MTAKELLEQMHRFYNDDVFPIMLENIKRKAVKGLLNGITEAEIIAALDENIDSEMNDDISPENGSEGNDDGDLNEELYETSQFIDTYDELFGNDANLSEDTATSNPINGDTYLYSIQEKNNIDSGSETIESILEVAYKSIGGDHE